jgi:hypothetical protein
VKTVFESDVSLRNYREKIEEIRVDTRMQVCVSMCQAMSAIVRCNVQITERFLRSNKLIFIHATTIFYAMS